jgi:hypothetical protein
VRRCKGDLLSVALSYEIGITPNTSEQPLLESKRGAEGTNRDRVIVIVVQWI